MRENQLGLAVEQNPIFQFTLALALGQIDGSQHRRLLMILIDRFWHHQLQRFQALSLAKTTQPVIFAFQFKGFYLFGLGHVFFNNGKEKKTQALRLRNRLPTPEDGRGEPYVRVTL